VRADGIEKMTQECIKISARIGQSWWYGPSWSIIDTYLYWAFSTAEKGGFPLDQFPVLVDHARRVRARPSFVRALAREQAALDAMGIADIVL
jgi:glutathione S-transferase